MKPSPEANLVTFTTKGQIVIPSALRRRFEIEEGTRASLTVTDDGILLKPVSKWAVHRGFGLLKDRKGGKFKAKPKSLEKEWAEHKTRERELEEAKHARHAARAR